MSLAKTGGTARRPSLTNGHATTNGVAVNGFHETDKTVADGKASISKKASLTRSDLNNQIELMRQQLATNVKFLEDAFCSVAGLQDEIQKMENRIGDEKKIQQKIESEKELVVKMLEQKEHEKLAVLEELKMQSDKVTEVQNEMKKMNKEALEQKLLDQATEISQLKDLIDVQKKRITSLSFLKSQIDSFRVGTDVLKEPCGACMLPDGTILVTDTLKGIFVFSSDCELQQHKQSEQWKWPQGITYCADKQRIYTCMYYTNDPNAVDKEGSFRRVIGIFDLNLELLGTIETPQGTGMNSICKENLTLDHRNNIYLSLADEIGAGIWMRRIEGRNGESPEWVELTKRSGVHYCYMHALLNPTIDVPGGSPQKICDNQFDLLVVESRTGYFHRFTLKDGKMSARDTLAVVPKPGALAVDEAGNIFVHDLQTFKVFQIDPITFNVTRDVCLVDDSVYSITAANGHLGIAVRNGHSVVVFRYLDVPGTAKSSMKSPFSFSKLPDALLASRRATTD